MGRRRPNPCSPIRNTTLIYRLDAPMIAKKIKSVQRLRISISSASIIKGSAQKKSVPHNHHSRPLFLLFLFIFCWRLWRERGR